MKFAYIALFACVSAVRLVGEPSAEPAKAPAIAKIEPKETATQETMDERIHNSLVPRIEANKEAQQKAWNAEDVAAHQDREHARGVLKGVNADVAGIKTDIATCKETQKNARDSRKGQNIDTYPEEATATPSNSYC